MKLLDILFEQQAQSKTPATVGFKSDYTGVGGELEKTFPIPQKKLKPVKKPTANTYSDYALEMIKKWEKFSNKNYLCPSKRNTIGYGTRLDFHPELKNRCITEAKAVEVLKEDLDKYAVGAIKKFIQVPLSQNQFDALCSLIYNIGRPKFAESNLLNDLNAKDWESLKQNWAEFRIGDGQVLPGWVKRRTEELKLFFA
jgi:lysozyme